MPRELFHKGSHGLQAKTRQRTHWAPDVLTRRDAPSTSKFAGEGVNFCRNVREQHNENCKNWVSTLKQTQLWQMGGPEGWSRASWSHQKIWNSCRLKKKTSNNELRQKNSYNALGRHAGRVRINNASPGRTNPRTHEVAQSIKIQQSEIKTKPSKMEQEKSWEQGQTITLLQTYDKSPRRHA